MLILINLDSAHVRRERMQAQLAAQSVEHERLGHDFRRLSRTAIAAWFEATYPFAKPTRRDLSCAELGCWASHLSAWDRIRASGHPAGIVLEDDVRLAPGFAGAVSALADDPGDFDLVYLGTSSRNLSWRRSVTIGALRVHAPVGLIVNTWGYVVRRRWIERLFAHRPFPLAMPVDHFLGGRGRVLRPRVGVLQPAVVDEDPETAHRSQIEPHTWRMDRLRVVEGARRRFLASRGSEWFYRLYRWL